MINTDKNKNIPKKDDIPKESDILLKIKKFDAGCYIDDLYILISEIHKGIEGDWHLIFNSKEPYKTFPNYIRNLIRRGIITKPSKIESKKFLFKPRNILEILVIRGCTANSIKMKAAKLYIQGLSDERLELRLFGSLISKDKDKIILKYEEFLLENSKDVPDIPDRKKFEHIRAGKGIILQLLENEYSCMEISKMIEGLKKHVH